MNVSMELYRLIVDINNKLSMTNFKRVEVSEEFFRDIEKVFESTKKETKKKIGKG